MKVDIGSALKFGKKKQDTPEDRALRLERAQELHHESPVVDGHLGTLWDLPSSAHGIGFSELREAGVKCAIVSAFPNDRVWPVRGVRQGLEALEEFGAFGGVPGVRLVSRSGDIDDALAQGDLGLLFAFEGGEFLEGTLETLRVFYGLGLRVLGLTWNERNALADGAGEGMTRGGLTYFGKQVLKEANRLGILIDAAHISEAGFWDVAEMSEQPFAVSHANCHALYGHPRNLTDDQLCALRDTGGLVGISLNPAYMAPSDQDVSISTVCDHIEHVIDVAGEDHVGLGTDVGCFVSPMPQGLSNIGELKSITLELLKRGIPGRTITGILGGNWMRLFRAVLG